jgi:hypothetical protein
MSAEAPRSVQHRWRDIDGVPISLMRSLSAVLGSHPLG